MLGPPPDTLLWSTSVRTAFQLDGRSLFTCLCPGGQGQFGKQRFCRLSVGSASWFAQSWTLSRWSRSASWIRHWMGEWPICLRIHDSPSEGGTQKQNTFHWHPEAGWLEVYIHVQREKIHIFLTLYHVVNNNKIITKAYNAHYLWGIIPTYTCLWMYGRVCVLLTTILWGKSLLS